MRKYRAEEIEGGSGNAEGLLKKMNIERPTSNVEWEKMKNRNSHTRFDIGSLKQIKLNCGAERHHYSMFNLPVMPYFYNILSDKTR